MNILVYIENSYFPLTFTLDIVVSEPVLTHIWNCEIGNID